MTSKLRAEAEFTHKGFNTKILWFEVLFYRGNKKVAKDHFGLTPEGTYVDNGRRPIRRRDTTLKLIIEAIGKVKDNLPHFPY